MSVIHDNPIQVNISMSPRDYQKLFSLMVEAKSQNRSAYIRSLIDRAWHEHQSQVKEPQND